MKIGLVQWVHCKKRWIALVELNSAVCRRATFIVLEYYKSVYYKLYLGHRTVLVFGSDLCVSVVEFLNLVVKITTV